MDLNLDPANTSSLYIIESFTVAITHASQVVTLPRAIHLSSLVVTQLIDETWTVLVLDTGYTTTTDDDVQSKALLQDETYDDTAIKSITLVAAPSGVDFYQIRVDGVTLDVDPDSSTGLLSENVGTLLSPIRCLEIDLTGGQINDDNHIIEEEWYVSTPNGKQVIVPACGSFYAHDIVVVNASGTALVEGTDFYCVGVNHLKTGLTHHTSAVYDAIVIVMAYTGALKVSYRAFGGDFTRADAYQLKAALERIRQLIENDILVTTDNLGNQALITSINESLGDLSLKVGSLWTGGYGGTWVSRAISVVDNDPHWYTFAEMGDDHDGNHVTRGAAMFRIAALNGTSFDCWFHVDIDLTRTGRECLVTPLSCHNLVDSSPIDGDFLELGSQVVPAVRLIWNPASETEPCVLQIRLAMPDVASGDMPEVVEVLIENRSAATGYWSILTFTETVESGAEDTPSTAGTLGNMTLPAIDSGVALGYFGAYGTVPGDGAYSATYDQNNDGIVDQLDWFITVLGFGATRAIINYREGQIVFAGSIPLDAPAEASDAADAEIVRTVETFGCLIGTDVFTSAIATVKYTIYDRYANSYFEVESHMTPRRSPVPAYVYTLDTQVVFFPMDLCMLRCRIGATALVNSVQIRITPYLGSHSLGAGMDIPHHRFDLVQIAVVY